MQGCRGNALFIEEIRHKLRMFDGDTKTQSLNLVNIGNVFIDRGNNISSASVGDYALQ